MDIKKITKLVDDLFWEYDRMTFSGQETLDTLGDLLKIPASNNEEKVLWSKTVKEKACG